MNSILLFALVCAIIIGIHDGHSKMIAAKKNALLGVKSSRNLFTFIFWDPYE